jgi:hypothetical protein
VAVGAGVTYMVMNKLDWFKSLFSFSGGSLGATDAKAMMSNAVGVHVRQIRRYAFAASQDQSPIVGLTHASYALVLLDTLEELIGKDAIRKAGYDPEKVRKFITEQQDRHAESMQKCDPHLQRVLEIERSEGSQIPGFVVAGAFAAPRGA